MMKNRETKAEINECLAEEKDRLDAEEKAIKSVLSKLESIGNCPIAVADLKNKLHVLQACPHEYFQDASYLAEKALKSLTVLNNRQNSGNLMQAITNLRSYINQGGIK